ncbi:hypothetical protein SBA4_4830015 [Candidatus Sulfopaludibacter sp. SbA4]|nr:hypothetical protein SBA4_4830015 [Candidatus Sulfopaludibacter sp. SbA4]
MSEKLPSPIEQSPVPVELVERRIYLIRGQKAMLDADLAELYQVPTKALKQAVRRNRDRFPEDFMFQLSKEELENWRSQIVTSNPAAQMGLRRPPYAFTELGVAMLSSVLHSKRAIQMNIVIMRAFVRMRELLASHKDLARRIEEVEEAQKRTTRTQQQHASVLVQVVRDIQRLKNPPQTRAIGFRIPPSPKKK